MRKGSELYNSQFEGDSVVNHLIDRGRRENLRRVIDQARRCHPKASTQAQPVRKAYRFAARASAMCSGQLPLARLELPHGRAIGTDAFAELLERKALGLAEFLDAVRHRATVADRCGHVSCFVGNGRLTFVAN